MKKLAWTGLVALCLGAAACGKGGTGTECSKPDDCSSGICLMLAANKQGKSGMCTTTCTGACESDAEACMPIGEESSVCLPRCQSASECKDGFICFEDISTSVRVCLVQPN